MPFITTIANCPAIGFRAFGGGNDAHTKCLLNFEGADGATTTTDTNKGGSAKTFAFNGNAQIDTAIVGSGLGALLLDGSGDFITAADHADFTLGANNFVAEIQFNVAGGAGARRFMFGQASSAGTTGSIFMELNASNQLQAGYFKASAGANAVLLAGMTAITTPGWHEGALIRSGNNMYVALDGVIEVGPTAIHGGSGSIDDSANAFSIGRLGEFNSLYWNGSLDRFRLSVGTDRGWASGYTPATLPYS